jgi:thioredoxin 1
MLKNCIADYAPLASLNLPLNPNEVVYHSFRVNLMQPQSLGYRPLSDQEFAAHFTNHRLVLQPLSMADTPSSTGVEDSLQQEFALAEVDQVKVVRSLFLQCFVKISFKAANQPCLYLAVQAFPQPGARSSSGQRSEDLVHLVNGLLTLNHPLLNSTSFPSQEGGLTLVSFSLPGCRPCNEMAKVLGAIAETHGDQITLVKVDAQKEEHTALRYGVNSFPTVLMVERGVVINQIVGAIPKSIVLKLLRRSLPSLATT